MNGRGEGERIRRVGLREDESKNEQGVGFTRSWWGRKGRRKRRVGVRKREEE
jgi:hypothetical protein